MVGAVGAVFRRTLKVNDMLSPCTVVVNIIARWQNNSFYFITYLLNFILILVRMQRSWFCSCALGLGLGLGLAVSALVLILVLYIWSWSENIGLVSNTGEHYKPSRSVVTSENIRQSGSATEREVSRICRNTNGSRVSTGQDCSLARSRLPSNHRYNILIVAM